MSAKRTPNLAEMVSARNLAIGAAVEVTNFMLAVAPGLRRSKTQLETEADWLARVDLRGRFDRLKTILQQLDTALSDSLVTAIEQGRVSAKLLNRIDACGTPVTTYHGAALQQARALAAVCVSAESHKEVREAVRGFAYMNSEDLLSGIRQEHALLQAGLYPVALDKEDRLILAQMAKSPAKTFTLDQLDEVDRKTAAEHVNALIARGLAVRPGKGRKGCCITPQGQKALELTQ